MQRIQYIADPKLVEIAPHLERTMVALADSLEPEELPQLMDEIAASHAAAVFDRIGASEGTLWVRDADHKHLVPVFNTGPHAEQFVLKHLQPLDHGIISMVFATELPFSESNVYQNESQDQTLDKSLEVLTCSMIAVPFGFAQSVRGVLSAVKLKQAADEGPDPEPFADDATNEMGVLSETLERFMDLRLHRLCLGTAHA